MRYQGLIRNLLFLVVAMTVCLGQAQAKTIEEGKTVKLDYTLSVDGQVVDSTRENGPVEFVQGSETILPALEERLTGLEEGAHEEISLAPDEAYGDVIEDAIVEIPKEELPAEGMEQGQVLAAQTPEGATLRGTVKEVKEETVLVDFNHPLAGKDLQFAIDIVEVS